MVHVIAIAVVLQLANVADVPPPTIARAQAEVVRLFDGVGIDVDWDSNGGVAADGSSVVRVVVLPYETGGLRQRADTVMGAAVRTAHGTSVAYVFYRRVEMEARRNDVPVALVLASAIAHELGHLLLPNGLHAGHTSDGLMRGNWTPADFHRAEKGQLRFSPEQSLLIRAAMYADAALPVPPAFPAPPALRVLTDTPAAAGTPQSCSLPVPPSSPACR